VSRWVSLGCWCVAAVAWAVAAVGEFGTIGPLTAMAVALTPAFTLGVIVSILTAACFRQWWPALASAALLIPTVAFGSVAGGSVATDTPVAGVVADGVVIVSSNVRAGNERIGELADRLAVEAPDIVVFQELQSTELEAVRRSALSSDHRFAFVDPRDGYFGGAIFSRWPLTGTVEYVGGYPMAMATVETPTGPLTVINVHVAPPTSWRNYELWSRQLGELHERLRRAAGPLVMLGDFNATGDHVELRVLSEVGSSRGLAAFRSFPVSGLMPPLLALDHAFVSGGACLVDVVALAENPGSDHRAMRATVASPYTLDTACR